MEVIYENGNTCIFYDAWGLFIRVLEPYHIYELSFADFIREIDIIPDKSPSWKQEIINRYAYKTGIFRDVA